MITQDDISNDSAYGNLVIQQLDRMDGGRSLKFKYTQGGGLRFNQKMIIVDGSKNKEKGEELLFDVLDAVQCEEEIGSIADWVPVVISDLTTYHKNFTIFEEFHEDIKLAIPEYW